MDTFKNSTVSTLRMAALVRQCLISSTGRITSDLLEDLADVHSLQSQPKVLAERIYKFTLIAGPRTASNSSTVLSCVMATP